MKTYKSKSGKTGVQCSNNGLCLELSYFVHEDGIWHFVRSEEKDLGRDYNSIEKEILQGLEAVESEPFDVSSSEFMTSFL